MKRIAAAIAVSLSLLFVSVADAGIMRVQSTAYCLRGRMANGTYTRLGSVAMNILPLGKTIRVSRSPTGIKTNVVRDRIGWGTQLDFWVPSCAQARAWGRRMVTVYY